MKATRTAKGNIKVVMSEKEASALRTLLVYSHYNNDPDLDPSEKEEIADAEWVSYRVCEVIPV